AGCLMSGIYNSSRASVCSTNSSATSSTESSFSSGPYFSSSVLCGSANFALARSSGSGTGKNNPSASQEATESDYGVIRSSHPVCSLGISESEKLQVSRSNVKPHLPQ